MKKYLICFFFVSFIHICYCDTKEPIKFLLSDAKEPDFDLRQFQDRREPKQDDSIMSESIILPTVNLESHPYAVVVLPNLDKFTSEQGGTENFLFGRYRKAESSDAGVKREIMSSNEDQTLDSSRPTLEIPNLKDISEEIPIIPIIRAKGEVVDLRSFGNNYNAKNDSSEERSYSSEYLPTPKEKESGEYDKKETFIEGTPKHTNKNKSKSYEANSKKEYDKSYSDESDEYETEERYQHSTGKSLYGEETYKISKESFGDYHSKTSEEYPPQKGDYLFSPYQVPVDSKVDLNSEEIYSKVIANIPKYSKKPPLPETNVPSPKYDPNIQTLPIVNQFSLLGDLVPPQKEFKTVPLYTINDNEYSKVSIYSQEGISQKESKDSKSEAESNEKYEETKQYAPYTHDKSRRIDPLRINDYIVETPETYGLEKPTYTSSEEFRSTNYDNGDLQKSYKHVVVKEHDSDESKEKPSYLFKDGKNPFLLEIYKANSSKANSGFPESAFEFVRSVGLPLPSFGQQSKNNSGSNILPYNFRVSSQEDPSSSEQSEQIKQLIKLRNQLSLLDTATFLNLNYAESSKEEVNPERSIGSTRITDKNPKNTVSGYDKESSKSSPSLEENLSIEQTKILNSKKEESRNKLDSIMTWSKFLNKNSKEAKEINPVTSKTSLKNTKLFNDLESIITPIKTPFIEDSRVNPNKTFNVEFEKFDITNAIPPKVESSTILSIEERSKKNTKDEDYRRSSEEKELFKNSSKKEKSSSECKGRECDSGEHVKWPGATVFTRFSSSSKKAPNKDSEDQFPSNEAEDKECRKGKCEEGHSSSQQDSKETPDDTFWPPALEARAPEESEKRHPGEGDEEITKSMPNFGSNTDEAKHGTIAEEESIQSLSQIPNKQYSMHSENVLTYDTVTKSMTVTVTKASPVFYTQTEIITQTDFVTITKTLPPKTRETSTVYQVVPKPSRLQLDPLTKTVTKTLKSQMIITKTVPSSKCDLSGDRSSKSYRTQLNNYGINPDNLVNNPSYDTLNSDLRKQYHNKLFDERYWPKEKFKRNIFPEGFQEAKLGSLLTDLEGSEEYSLYEDARLQGSSVIPTISLPEGESGNFESRSGRGLQHNYYLVYGTPFYGYKPQKPFPYRRNES